jgi:hypothetical protein
MRRKYRIHPAIGIARLGNAPDEFFLGPEAPGVLPLPEGPYKDAHGLIKRQAVRYRIFRDTFDDSGRLASVEEITSSSGARIEWRVHLANKKAAANSFPPGARLPRRNDAIDDRGRLIIDAGGQSISGANQSKHLAGSFLDTPVDLGELRTDGEGRLVVLGGLGISRSVPEGEPIENFANNDLWCDDTSDGPVAATVRLDGGQPIEAEPAWVIVAPPDYAPPVENIVTLYDVVFQVATELDASLAAIVMPSFTRDIFPILRRVVGLTWVNPRARSGHGDNPHGAFLRPELLARLADNGPSSRGDRERVFARIRSPFGDGFGDMPLLFGGLNPEAPAGPRIPPTLTEYQHRLMKDWSVGLFEADWTGAEPMPLAFEAIPEAGRPAALDRAALEACVGDPFFPGIETGYVIARRDTYEAPFRIARSKAPGDLTAEMAVPWQADFIECARLWWPGQRPDSVRRNGAFAEWVPPEWTNPNDMQHVELVRNWWRLGFIVQQGDEFVEQERDLPFIGV